MDQGLEQGSLFIKLSFLLQINTGTSIYMNVDTMVYDINLIHPWHLDNSKKLS